MSDALFRAWLKYSQPTRPGAMTKGEPMIRDIDGISAGLVFYPLP